jgi:hypothetical protein
VNILYSVFLFVIITGTSSFSQSISDKFYSVGWNATIPLVKALFHDKKILDKDFPELKEIYFIDKIDSAFFKVGFFFTIDGNLSAKAINNVDKNTKAGKEFFNLFKNLTIKKYGENFDKKTVAGVDLLYWDYDKDTIVMLSQIDEKATLTVSKKKDPNKAKNE